MRKIENIADLGRIEVIEELRYVARPTWFHSMLELSTPALKAILMFYHAGGDDKEIIRMAKEAQPKKEVNVVIAHGGGYIPGGPGGGGCPYGHRVERMKKKRRFPFIK